MNEYYNIRIDKEVMNHLKSHAKPFEDKEPNDVLRRELGISKIETITDTTFNKDKLSLLKLDDNLPDALQQILQVIFLVKVHKVDRDKAAKLVAQYRGIEYSTVSDKYCRQLGQTTEQFDALLKGPEINLKENLINKFAYYTNEIENFFKEIS